MSNKVLSTNDEQESIEAYLLGGGKITKLKSQKLPKIKPTIPQSSVPHVQKGRYGFEVTVEKSEKKVVKARANNPDGITLQSILEEFGVKGTVARKALRASDIEKPGKQWVWNQSDKKAIKAVRKFINHLSKE